MNKKKRRKASEADHHTCRIMCIKQHQHLAARPPRIPPLESNPHHLVSLLRHAHSKTAAITPTATPATPPSTLPTPLFPVAFAALALALILPDALVIAAADVLAAKAATSVGLRVPQDEQALEPGLAWRQFANSWTQMWLGRVSE